MTRFLMERVAEIGGYQWRTISLVLTDDSGIREVNRLCFKRAETTDVISLRYDPAPGDDGLFGADIVVNVERALKTPTRSGPAWRQWDASKELALYIAHGCDHLTGADDHTATQRARMRRRELRWLSNGRTAALAHELI